MARLECDRARLGLRQTNGAQFYFVGFLYRREFRCSRQGEAEQKDGNNHLNLHWSAPFHLRLKALSHRDQQHKKPVYVQLWNRDLIVCNQDVHDACSKATVLFPQCRRFPASRAAREIRFLTKY